MKRRLVPIVLLAVVVVVIAATLFPNPREVYTPDLTVIMHAGGAVEGQLSTNSMEALEQSYSVGCRTVELDFNFSSDGYPVCIHDWHERFSGKIKSGEPMSKDEFLSCKIYETYTPMWIGDVAEFMRHHRDLFVVTDVKDDNLAFAAYLAENYPDLRERFIIQIYQKEEYEPIRELGFENVIFTLYRMSWEEIIDFEGLKQFAEETGILAYTFDHTLLEMEFYPLGMKTTGVPLLVHTVNEPELKQRYYEMGITGIYTDYME